MPDEASWVGSPDRPNPRVPLRRQRPRRGRPRTRVARNLSSRRGCMEDLRSRYAEEGRRPNRWRRVRGVERALGRGWTGRPAGTRMWILYAGVRRPRRSTTGRERRDSVSDCRSALEYVGPSLGAVVSAVAFLLYTEAHQGTDHSVLWLKVQILTCQPRIAQFWPAIQVDSSNELHVGRGCSRIDTW